VDAVFYPVALNVIPMKKKQKPAKKSRPAIKPTAQNERLKDWNEIASFRRLVRLVRYDAVALEKFLLRNLRVSKARATMEENRVAL
jgi:hypothetical protein